MNQLQDKVEEILDRNGVLPLQSFNTPDHERRHALVNDLTNLIIESNVYELEHITDALPKREPGEKSPNKWAEGYDACVDDITEDVNDRIATLKKEKDNE